MYQISRFVGYIACVKERTRQEGKKRLVVGRDKLFGKNDQLAFRKIAEVASLPSGIRNATNPNLTFIRPRIYYVGIYYILHLLFHY